MAPRTLEQLQKISDFVLGEVGKGTPPASIIAQMVSIYGAKFRWRDGTYTLSAAGVGASCTWSEDKGLLAAWRRNAVTRLAREAMK